MSPPAVLVRIGSVIVIRIAYRKMKGRLLVANDSH